MLVYNSHQCFICHVQLCSEIHFAYITYTGAAMFWRHYSTHARCTGEVPMNRRPTPLLARPSLCPRGRPPAVYLKMLEALPRISLRLAIAPHARLLQLPPSYATRQAFRWVPDPVD